MWDRSVNFVYEFVRELPNKAFVIIMAILITLGFYFIGKFLKANKNEAPKVNKISNLLISIFMIVIVIILTNIRY